MDSVANLVNDSKRLQAARYCAASCSAELLSCRLSELLRSADCGMLFDLLNEVILNPGNQVALAIVGDILTTALILRASDLQIYRDNLARVAKHERTKAKAYQLELQENLLDARQETASRHGY